MAGGGGDCGGVWWDVGQLPIAGCLGRGKTKRRHRGENRGRARTTQLGRLNPMAACVLRERGGREGSSRAPVASDAGSCGGQQKAALGRQVEAGHQEGKSETRQRRRIGEMVFFSLYRVVG